MDDKFNEFQIVVSSSSPGSGLKASKSLRNWLQAEDFDSGFEVKQERKALEEDDAGGELMSALGVNMGSSIIADFGSSVFNWFRSRSSREKGLSIKIKTVQGHEIAISADSIGNGEQQFIQNLVKLINDGNPTPAQAANTVASESTPNTWKPSLTLDQWQVSHQNIQQAIMQGEIKKAMTIFENLLENEGLTESLSLVKIRMAEWERADRDFKFGTIAQEYYDRKINTINKVVLDLLVEMDGQIKQINL